MQRWREKSWPDCKYPSTRALSSNSSGDKGKVWTPELDLSLPPSSAHYSTVTIQLNQEQDCAKLVLLQTGVPEDVAERTKLGWKTHIFERIKTVFGYGARLL